MSVTKDSLAQTRSRISTKRANLSPRKRQELEALLKTRTVQPVPARVIPRRPPEDPAPLSFAQERLWFLEQLNPQSTAYNICIPVRLTGRLNFGALAQALDAVVNRHESLRTTFTAVDGKPVQVISPSQNLDATLVDIRGLAPAEREFVANRVAGEGRHRNVDLTQGPLLRAALVRLRSQEHVLLITLHHIVFDEWSMRVLIRDASLLYKAFDQGGPSNLSELPIQYADFAKWQRELLKGEVLEKELSYWRDQLRDCPSTNLPIDRPRPVALSFDADTVSTVVPESLTWRLNALARTARCTLFMTLLASVQMLLSRYSGQDDIPIGIPVAGRRWVETEELIGFFVNTLVIRSRITGDPSALEVLALVRRLVLDAQNHQDLPFEKLVEELRPERSLGGTPFFQVMLAFRTAQDSPVQVKDLNMSLIETPGDTEKFALTLLISEGAGGLDCSFSYSTDLFERSTIERLGMHWRNLLEGMVANPDRPFRDIEVLSEAEKSWMLDQWNDTGAAFPVDLGVHQLVEHQAKRRPDAIAAKMGLESITYRQLNRAANQLASYLLRLGVSAGDLVGVCLEHSLEAVAALLGILKCGAAYLPLDPGHPPQRLSFTLNDGGATLVLTQESLVGLLLESGVRLVCLDRDWHFIAREKNKSVRATAGAQDLAYVIYTSGSTGTPKGVAVGHKSLVNYLCWARDAYLLDKRVAFPLYSSLAFDLTVTSIFAPLVSGGQIVIYPQRDALPPMLDIIAEDEVQALKATPSHLALINGEQNRANGLKRLIIGGEALTAKLANDVCHSLGGRVEIYNEYGPTEATVGCMIYRFDATGQRSQVPIGSPAANTRIYVLDKRLEPVGIDMTGEICIGGDCLAYGYWDRGDLTAERFLPNPFCAEDAGQRIYRTGDEGRMLDSGALEFLGRRDEQIKLRGYRIELGEIESVLVGHPYVRDALVVAAPVGENDNRLVAYLVAYEGSPLDFDELRSFLRERLPDYMVPSAWVRLDAIPLTRNGKVDRASLPDPVLASPDNKLGFSSPRTLTEKVVAEIWARLLGLERVSRDDNFFAFGGHSLLATQIVSRIRDNLQVELPLRTLFEAPVLWELSKRVEALIPAVPGVKAPSLAPRLGNEELLLSYGQQRLWFLDQLTPGSTVYNMPIGVRSRGALAVDCLEQSVIEIVRRHESLRTNFAAIDGRPVQVVVSARLQQLRLVDIEGLAEHEREDVMKRLGQKEIERPFNLAEDRLLRTTVLRVSPSEHALLLIAHHIVSDGLSMEILMREASIFYQEFHRGRPSPLDELPIQYPEYALWQRQWLSGEVLDADLAYWRNQLRRSVPLLNLPADRRRPAALSLEGDSVTFILPNDLTENVRKLSRSQGSTLFVTLLAAFQMLLSRYSGQNDISVGTPVGGRRWSATEEMIGFFVNTLVLRIRLEGHLSLRQVAQRVRDIVFDAQAHQDLPFEMLVEELRPERSLSYAPLFQSMFVFQVASPTLPELDGLVAEELDLRHRGEKIDLTLRITEERNRLVCSLNYSTDLFDEITIRRMSTTWRRIVTVMAAGQEQLLREVKWLSDSEEHQALLEWNATGTEYSDSVTLHALFEERVVQTPDAIAASIGDRKLTYKELDGRASQLGQHLRRCGVQVETRVALYLERSIEMIVALLGVLKSGGAYVPLDTSQPKRRVTQILEDAGAAVILTEQRLRPEVETSDRCVLCLDSAREKVAQESTESPLAAVQPENLAYVIYTSGSTGSPRGVKVQHRSVVNLASLLHGELGTESGTHRVSLNAPLMFDSSVKQVVQVAYGSELCIVPEEARRDPAELVAYVAQQGIDILDCTPSQLRIVLEDAKGTGGLGSAAVLVGGEAIDENLWRDLAEMETPRFINVYGPTECTVDATLRRIGTGSSRPSIGVPLANITINVLDDNWNAVGIGIPGEICIGGAGVARGYLGAADVTAERFVPNQHAVGHGERQYRSGDMGRYRGNGEIEFIGRADHQAKIRGHRIEPAEVEAALKSQEQVADAVVVVVDDGGEKRLVAYIVPAKDSEATLVELQTLTRQLIPDYMMPAGWVLLEEMPLTPNGKVDRSALPDSGRVRPDTGWSFVASQNMIEEVLAGIWKQILRVEEIGRDDNFFWLGGHSLLATQVISRIRESLHVELPVRALFSAPTLLALSQQIENSMRSGASLSAPSLKGLRADLASETPLPLSYAQQRLWFLDQLIPGANAYNLPADFEINSEINAGTLEQCLAEVVRRHEALRTTFLVSSGQPVQRISPAATLVLPLVDLSGLNPEERGLEAQRLKSEDILRPFDLAEGPLIRRAILTLDAARHLFLVNLHHIVSDGWSMGLLLQEMETLYGALTKGDPSPMAELEVQYADYALWQRAWLQGPVLAREVEYWKERLDGASTVLEIETDQPPLAPRAVRGTHLAIAISPEVSSSLRQFSRQEGATLFMTLMAGFHALLRRYTNQEDVLVGTPVAGRGRVEIEPLIGFFVNMVPLRTSFAGAPTFRQLLKQVRESALGAYTHQDLPFDKLVEELQPRRAPGRNPIFQAILAFQNAVKQRSNLGAMSLPAGAPLSADIKFDIEVHLQDSPEGVGGSLVYRPDLFDPALMASMVKHFRRLFEKAMEAPDIDLSALSLLDETELRQVVEEWNDTSVPIPDDACIHDLVELEARQRPDAIALEFEDEVLTYRGLNSWSNVLAHRLRRQGVRQEVLVGVLLERSAELIAGLLAVAKAGGVYVPVNLADPPLRVRFIVENAGINVLLTNKRIAESLPENQLALVCVDSNEEETVESGDDFESDPASGVSPDNLAYVMYTSGSTGTPKGVCITHRGIVGLVKGANYARLSADEVFLQFAPVSFDASTFEIWAALLNGARLVVFPPGVPSLAELGEFIERVRVTTLFLTTGLFHQFVDTSFRGIGAVKQLLTGGDALSPSHLNKAMEQTGDCLIVNCYGPTESTVMACCYQAQSDRPKSSVPIGRPISNSRVYVINGTQPAGIGEKGELLIGGAGLARGYLGRPDLTSERFVPDPYGPQPGGRLYRTGDGGRYLNRGVLQFVGRLDNQVKISGFRIEPGEIESVLSQHPAVKAAVVLVRENGPGDKRLVAYVVAQGENAPAVDDLRNHLRQRVPEYMVPAAFVFLDELPLTLHGKVDRAALPAPEFTITRSGKEYVAPRNGLQQQLVDIWEELFKLHPIGVTDNFFELGGHSLMMVMLVARIEERMGKRVPMAALFKDATIEGLSDLIGHGKETLSQSLLVPMQPNGSGPMLFFPHASGGHVWCYRDLVGHLGGGHRFYGLQAREPENGLVYHTQIEAMATEYVEAIKSCQPAGPYLLGGWSMGGVIAYEVARQLQDQGEKIALLALIDSQAPTGEQSEYNSFLLLSVFARELGLTPENLSKPVGEIAALPQMAQLRQIWTDAKLNGFVPSDMTLVDFRKVFDTFKINANTMRSYRPGGYQGRLTLFVPQVAPDEFFVRKKSVDSEESSLSIRHQLDPLKGWGNCASAGVDIVVVPGDHYSMMQDPLVEVLAEQLSSLVEKAIE